jgi:hypothetical protein
MFRRDRVLRDAGLGRMIRVRILVFRAEFLRLN